METGLTLTQLLDILGTFSFAVSGAFAAMDKKLDPFGVLIIAFVTAIGGGTLRDMMIGDLPVAWLTNLRAAAVILAGTVMAMFFSNRLKKLSAMLFIFDAAGLGLFTLAGIQKGISHSLPEAICIALGTITGCFGGVLRDVLLNNVPLIFKKEIYASACILAGILYFLLVHINIGEAVANAAAITSIIIMRLLAVRYNWSLPKWYNGKE